jgi:hypothetical protein
LPALRLIGFGFAVIAAAATYRRERLELSDPKMPLWWRDKGTADTVGTEFAERACRGRYQQR